MRTQLIFKTDAGLARFRKFMVSFGLPAPIIIHGWGHAGALLTDLHRLQLNALRLGWKNLRTARAELKQVSA